MGRHKDPPIYMAVTRDKYELPIAVADSIPELAELIGRPIASIRSGYSRNVKWLVKIGGKELGRREREKGKRGERELAKLLREHGIDARRGQQFCGANGDADVVGLDGYHIECKRVEKLNLEKAMQQSTADAKGDEVPVVIFRKNGGEWMVVERFESWIEKVKEV